MTVSGQHSPSRLPMIMALVVFCLFYTAAKAQPVSFTLRTDPECPVALVSYTKSMFRTAATCRQFVTVKNVSGREVAGLLFQQAIPDGSRLKIIALEQASTIMRPHATKRLSVNVDDVWSLIQISAKTGVTVGKPELSIVVVDFVDGSTWIAPVGQVER